MGLLAGAEFVPLPPGEGILFENRRLRAQP